MIKNCIKREENMKIILFSIFKLYSKLYSTPQWHDANLCKVLSKYSHAF